MSKLSHIELEIINTENMLSDEIKLKLLYTNDSGCGCCTRWSEYADPVLETAILNRKLSDYSIIHRMKKEPGGHGQSGRNYQTHSIVLRGTPLMNIVREVFDGYLGLDLEGTEITFVTPFKPIVHRWAQLEKLATLSRVTPGNSIDLAKKLIELFQPLVAPYLAALQDAKTLGTISFSLLWTLFTPGDIVIKEKMGVCSAYRIISLKLHQAENPKKPSWWDIHHENVDWNGATTGYVIDLSCIFEKRDTSLRLAALPILPLSLREDRVALKGALLARGRRFEKLRGYQYKMCVGKKVLERAGAYCELPVGSIPLVKIQILTQSSGFWSRYHRCICVLQLSKAGYSRVTTLWREAHVRTGAGYPASRWSTVSSRFASSNALVRTTNSFRYKFT